MCTTKWVSVVLIALQQLLTCMKYSYPHTRGACYNLILTGKYNIFSNTFKATGRLHCNIITDREH